MPYRTLRLFVAMLFILPQPLYAASAAARLKALGYHLPPTPLPSGNYLNTYVDGKRVLASAQPAVNKRGNLTARCDGKVLSEHKLREAARDAALNLLAAGVAAAGSLRRLKGLAQLDVHIACAGRNANLDDIADAASRVFVRVFGRNGQHSRNVSVVRALPGKSAVTAGGEFLLK